MYVRVSYQQTRWSGECADHCRGLGSPSWCPACAAPSALCSCWVRPDKVKSGGISGGARGVEIADACTLTRVLGQRLCVRKSEHVIFKSAEWKPGQETPRSLWKCLAPSCCLPGMGSNWNQTSLVYHRLRARSNPADVGHSMAHSCRTNGKEDISGADVARCMRH